MKKKNRLKFEKTKQNKKHPTNLNNFLFIISRVLHLMTTKKKIHGLVLMNEYGLDTDEFVKNRKIIEN